MTLIENLINPDPTDSTYEMTFLYLIRRLSGEHSLTLEVDHHIGGIFSEAVWSRLIIEVGFAVYQKQFSEDGFPFFFGLKS